MGFTLVRRRQRDTVRIGDRPVAEILDEVQQDDSFFERYGRGRETSLIRGTTLLFATAADRLAGWMGEKSADTEQGALFFELYAEPSTLAIDLGVPVQAGLFTGEVPGLRIGDSVEHTTFLGLVPVRFGFRKSGLQGSLQSFFRFLRQTTLTRESERFVRVRVRNVFGRGLEVIPLKVRPELRILGLVKLGYTLYEAKLGQDAGTSSAVEYLVDLEAPGALDAFRQLLGDGTRVSWRPLAEAALRADGVRVLDRELRRGGERYAQHRLRLFSWMKYQNRALASTSHVELADESFRELVRLRSRKYARGGRRWDTSSSITAQGNVVRRDEDGTWRADSEGHAAVSIVTSVANHRATEAEVRLHTELLRTILNLETTPEVLRELAAYRSPDPARFAWNLELSFDGPLIRKALTASDADAWQAVGDLFLGPGEGGAWRTEESRRAWKRQRRAARDAQLEPILAAEVGGRKALRLAGKLVDRLEDFRRYGAENCLKCLSRAYGKRKELALLQALLVRLAGGADRSGVGYHFEIFVDDMLAPATVTNGIRHVFRRDVETPDVETREAWSEDAMGRVEFSSSDARLRGGFLWLNRDPASADAECWLLRLFSDLVLDPELRVRIDLREGSNAWADPELVHESFPVGAPREVVMTPFMTSRYYYDVGLPHPGALEDGEAYTLLIRVLNDGGYPVTEEQQIRFTWPRDASERIAPACRAAPARTTAELTAAPAAPSPGAATGPSRPVP